MVTEKYCKGCGETKPASEFYLARGKYLSTLCKPCDIKKAIEYGRQNPERRKQYRQKSRKKTRDTVEGKAREIHESMVQRSRERGFDYPEWTVAEVLDAIRDGRCELTNIPFEVHRRQSGSRRNPWAPSPDRIDPNKGYTKENVRWVCFMANILKQDWSDADIAVFFDAIRNANKPGNF